MSSLKMNINLMIRQQTHLTSERLSLRFQFLRSVVVQHNKLLQSLNHLLT